jgi:hypothetical protein
MSYTKRQIIGLAFEELGLAGHVFDISPEEQQSAMLRLDSMMAMWNGQGIRIGYNMTVDPLNADPDQDSGISDMFTEAVFLNLAIRLASSYGKQVARTTSAPAKQAYDALLAQCMATPVQIQPNVVPAGAGNRWRRFTRPPVDRLQVGPDGLLDFEG